MGDEKAKPTVISSTTDFTAYVKKTGSTFEGLPVVDADDTVVGAAENPRAFFEQNALGNLNKLLKENNLVKIEAKDAASYSIVAEGDKLNMVDIGNVDRDSATSLTLSGSGKVYATLQMAKLTTIDASANSGGVYVKTYNPFGKAAASAEVGDLTSVKGGTGDDLFYIQMSDIGTVSADTDTSAASERTFALRSVLDGGAGDDVLALSVELDGGDHLVLNKDSFAGKLSGFEHIMLDKIGTSNSFEIDAAGFGDMGVEELILQSSATITNVDGLGNNGTKPNISVLCQNPNAESDTIALDVSASQAVQTLDLDVIMTNAPEGVGNPNGFLSLTTSNITAINLTGHDVNAVVKYANTSSAAMTLDASAYLGKLEYTASGMGDTIKLGKGADKVIYNESIFNASRFGDTSSTTFTGYDTITGWNDKDLLCLNFDDSLAFINYAGDLYNIDAVIASINTDINADKEDGGLSDTNVWFFLSDTDAGKATITAIYAVHNINGDKVVDKGEIILVGTIDGDATVPGEGWVQYA